MKTSIIDWMIDLVFPKNCSRCGQEGHYFCLIKKEPKPIIEFYSRLKKGWHLDGLMAATSYDNEPVRQAVHWLKYDRVADVATDLGKWMVNQLGVFINTDAVIVPVPLHKKRLVYRGFNQANLLTMAFEQAGWEAVEALIRHKNNSPQVELKRSERSLNIVNVFGPSKSINRVNAKIVFLLDDVATTGSTLNAAAKMLKKHGARKVFGLVAARD